MRSRDGVFPGEPMRPRSAPFHSVAVAALLLAGVAAVAGCASPPPSSSVAPSGLVAPSPADEPAATFGPDRAALAAFESHLRQAVGEEANTVDEVEAASSKSAADLATAVDHLRTLAAEERAWLATHPAAACYQPAADAFGAAIQEMSGIADAFAGAAAGPPNPSDEVSVPSAQVAGANAIEAARSKLNEVSGQAAAARSTCT